MTEEVSRRESHGFTITSGLSPSPKSAPYKGKWQRLSQTMGDRESVDLPANQAESFIICLRIDDWHLLGMSKERRLR